MPLSRNLLVSHYGDLAKLEESKSVHGGYGNVTWNIGPHAGPDPYPGYKVSFVSRDKLLAGYRQHPDHEIEQHANAIGQQMDRGDVIHIPHVTFVGGNANMDIKHAAAIRAAFRRGADRVPVVYQDNDVVPLLMKVGGIEKPAAPRADQDVHFKWRWNGKGWYTKPSFNQGRCPPGSQVNQGADQCIGGGPAPAPKIAPQRRGASDSDDSQQPRPVAPPRRQIQPPAPPPRPAAPPPPPRPAVPPSPPAPPAAPQPPQAPRAGDQLPPVVKIDRSQIPGAPVRLPPGYALAPEVLQDRMDAALEKGYGGEFSIEPDADDDYNPNRKRTKKAIQAAINETKQKDPSFNPGKILGAGAAGAVFEGPVEPDGTKTVYKFDAGPYEARLADAAMKAGLIGKKGLAILPRYIKTYSTSQKVTGSNLPLHIIHREDLENTSKHLDSRQMNMLGEFGYGLQMISTAAMPKHRPADVDPGVPWWGGGGKKRKDLLKMYDDIVGHITPAMQHAGGNLAQQWGRIHKDIRTLIEHGIVPCDTHAANWGVRKSTGEIAIRDVGCNVVVDD